MNSANLIERLEPDTGMSLGKVIEPILITLASKILADLPKIVPSPNLYLGAFEQYASSKLTREADRGHDARRDPARGFHAPW